MVSRAQATAAQVTGLPPEKVQVHNHLIGGGFGRRLDVDGVTQAVAIAKQVDGPVKVVWSREEDIQHDVYRPYYYDRLAAGLDAQGMPVAWSHRVTGSSIVARWLPPAFKDGLDFDAVEGAAKEMPYAIPNILVDYVRTSLLPGITTGWWRGVGPTHNIFVVESFIDELAAAAKKDPVEYRRALLGKAPRMLGVLDLAAEKAGWGKPAAARRRPRRLGAIRHGQLSLADRRGRGVEGWRGQGSARGLRGRLRSDRQPRHDQGADRGRHHLRHQRRALGRDHAQGWPRRADIISTTIGCCASTRRPVIEVHLVNSTEAPGGIGEPGTVGIAPAVANAIFAADRQAHPQAADQGSIATHIGDDESHPETLCSRRRPVGVRGCGVAVGCAPAIPRRSRAALASSLRSLRERTPPAFPLPSPEPISLPAANISTRAADCAACHTAPGGKPFTGGLAFKLPMIGTLYSTNITPDDETGIGAWSDDEFVRALHDGIGKDGEHLYPAFPYTSYTLMTRDDALAIKAYLFNLKPVKYTPPPNDISFPFNQRYLMAFWNVLFNPAHRFQPNADQSPEWNRGAYLVEALGHCGDCHTPRNILFGLKSHQKFAGAIIQGWKAYNITPDPKWGIGAWSDSQLQDYLAHGHADGRSSASGPMAEVVDNSLRFLSQDDIGAMAAYLKSVPSRGGTATCRGADPSWAAAAPQGSAASPAATLLACAFSKAPAWLSQFRRQWRRLELCDASRHTNVNDPAGLNATQAILQGTHVHTALGKVFMPGFGNGYSDAEIAAVVNYVTGRFGTSASALTPKEIAKRRQAN